MIQLFKNIENYKDLSLKDLAVVAKNYVYFVPRYKALIDRNTRNTKVVSIATNALVLIEQRFQNFIKQNIKTTNIAKVIILVNHGYAGGSVASYKTI